MAVCRFKRKFYHECGWSAKRAQLHLLPRKRLNAGGARLARCQSLLSHFLTTSAYPYMNGAFQGSSATEDLARTPKASHRGDSREGKGRQGQVCRATALQGAISHRHAVAKRSNFTGGSMASRADAIPMGGTAAPNIWGVILASSVGTMIEWYDFYIFGSLAAVLSLKFYPQGNATFAYIAYLSTFAVGFMVRPFGALFFGRIGDLVGRKYAFLVTLTVMGFGTFLIGLMPTYAKAGWFAPIALIAIRVFQGLALGGEYGGAAIYVAEHVPDNKRGYWTSYIQITATLGLFFSVITVVVLQFYMTPANFQAYGWRIPFLLSVILVMISLYIRLKMAESPIFTQIKSTGMSSAQPLKDAFTQWPNFKLVLISLLGATAGQGVVWYTGQYYALFYLQSILKVNLRTGYIIVAVAMLLGMPFFTVFGALSDKIGRKKIIMAGCLLAVVTYYPIYHAMETAAGNHVITFKSQKNAITAAWTLTPLTPDPADPTKLVPAKEAP